MFPSGLKDGEVLDYDGDRISEEIVTWALYMLAEHIPPPELVEVKFFK